MLRNFASLSLQELHGEIQAFRRHNRQALSPREVSNLRQACRDMLISGDGMSASPTPETRAREPWRSIQQFAEGP